VVEWQDWGGFTSLTRFYRGTDTRADSLLVGSLLALLLAHGVFEGQRWADRVLRKLALPAGILVLVFLVADDQFWSFNWTYGLTLFALSTGIVLYNVLVRSWLGRLLETGALVWIGRRSYGLYLWHYAILRIALAEFGKDYRLVPLLVALSVFAAALSYTYVELPFLRLKNRAAARDRPEAAPAPASAA
jgi:peptidoglycan/LPS O-acetylase OafA/YrhL